jgi:hypothetical protein
MAEQQRQRLFVTPHLMQLQRQLACQRSIGRVVRNLLLQLLNFRRIRRLFQQLNLRHQPLIAGILILQGDGFQHRFRFIGTVQGNQRFRQQQANLAVLIRQLPGVFQQRQRRRICLPASAPGLLRFQLFFARQDFIQQARIASSGCGPWKPSTG